MIEPRSSQKHHAESDASASQDSIAWRKHAEIGCSAFMLLISAAAIEMLFVRGLLIWPSVWLSIIVVLVYLTSKSNVVLLLSALVLCWTFKEPGRSQMNPSLDSIASVFFALCFLAWACRYQEIRRGLLNLVLRLSELDLNKPSSAASAPVAVTSTILSHLIFYMKLLVFGLSAVFLLRNQPWTFESEPWFSWTMRTKQVLWPGPSLIVLIIGTLLCLSELTWRMRTRRQKRMFLRSDGAKSLYPDLRRIKS